MAMKGKAKTIDLFVWDAESKSDFCNLNQFHRRQVCHVSFSPDGTKLLSVGRDDDNSLAIHDWQSKALLCTSNVDKAKVTGVCWCSNTTFMTCGVKHIKVNININNNLFKIIYKRQLLLFLFYLLKFF